MTRTPGIFVPAMRHALWRVRLWPAFGFRLGRDRRRQFRGWLAFGLVALAPLCALATYLVLGPLEQKASSPLLRIVLLADVSYILVLTALVLVRVAKAIAARRSRSTGARLHLRLTRLFALIALLPTMTVAIFAVLSINLGLEAWFSERVRAVVGASLEASRSYHEEQREGLAADVTSLAAYIASRRVERQLDADDGELRVVLQTGQVGIQRGLRAAFVIDEGGQIRARGDKSYLFDYEQPTVMQLAEARETGLLLIPDWSNDEFRALVPITGFSNAFLHVTREVDGQLLRLLDEAEATAQFYRQIENTRGRLLFDFGLLYLGFAMLLILAAVWLGLWFAERLSRPVTRLATAVQRVGNGDFDVRVNLYGGGIDRGSDDEFALLAQHFNGMTERLKAQHTRLLENTQQIEERQQLFDSVLNSVTSGVIGLDRHDRVEFINRAAAALLLSWGFSGLVKSGSRLVDLVPEFGPLLREMRSTAVSRDGVAGSRTGDRMAQQEVTRERRGQNEHLLVRIARRRSGDEDTGYVVVLDDVTELVTAQRVAAWGDVARRMAHEIKNPLTPIRLAAQRIQKKFGTGKGEESEQLRQMTDAIVRQTKGLSHIVEEFSRYARMSKPAPQLRDLVEVVRSALLLQGAGLPGVDIAADFPDRAVMMEFDDTMITQTITNLVKNAGEAIEARKQNKKSRWFAPRIRVTLTVTDRTAELTIADNGIGLPEERSRLLEPYVTSREGGTGLGLPIVRKIVAEHGGTFGLADAPDFDGDGHNGAQATISLPLAPRALRHGKLSEDERKIAGLKQTADRGTDGQAQ